MTAVCGRTCAWFQSLPDKEFYMQQNDIFAARLNAGVIDPNNPFSYSSDAQYAFVLSRAENAQFEQYCAAGNSAQVGGRVGSPVCGCMLLWLWLWRMQLAASCYLSCLHANWTPPAIISAFSDICCASFLFLVYRLAVRLPWPRPGQLQRRQCAPGRVLVVERPPPVLVSMGAGNWQQPACPAEDRGRVAHTALPSCWTHRVNHPPLPPLSSAS